MQTPLTLKRRSCIKPIVTTINSVINQMPQLRGLKAHIARNFSNIFLSYHEKKDAFNPRIGAQSFLYPVWRHFAKTPTGNFLYEPTKLRDLDIVPIFNTINEIVPPTARPIEEVSMTPQNKRARGTDSNVPAGPGSSRAHGNL